MEKLKVLLDTNFLLTMIRYKLHAFEEIKSKMPVKFYVLSGVMDELHYLSKDKKIAKELKLVEQVLLVNKVELIKSTTENVDKELIQKSNEYLIATNDKELRKKIREIGGKTIFIRKMAFVEIDGLFN
ncbi:MAG: hypothetical protein PHQ98_03170 [Candidatus ainarchaeum sp.]|nr:hypothetical protein [Candidatus ainarchaeum sp.]